MYDMSEGKVQIFITHRSNTNMGINGKSYCPVGNMNGNATCTSQALTSESICQSIEMLKYINLNHHDDPVVVSESCDVYLPWKRYEPSDVQLDFHRPCSAPRFGHTANESTGNPFCSIGRSCMNDNDHDSMKCLNTCCYRLPTLPEGVSVCEAEQSNSPVNASSPLPRVPSATDVVSTDVIPPPWKTIETEPQEPVSAGQHGATQSSRTQSEQNSGPLYITDSTCHCTWTGTGAAHYRGSRRNSLVPTATGSSRRRCSQQLNTAERVAIFDGDDDETLMLQGRAERSWSWLLDCPMTVEEEEVRSRRNSSFREPELNFPLTNDIIDLSAKFVASTGSVPAGGNSALSDHCLLPTAMQLLLTRSHSACELSQPVEHQISSWLQGDQLHKSTSVPNLAFI